MKNRGIFITATDTGVGKTMVGCALAVALRGLGADVGVLKPVSCGGLPEDGEALSDDARYLAAAAGVSDPPRLVNPCAYRLPLAPLVAAEKEGRTFDRAAVLRAGRELAARHELLLVEGAGGLLVPLAKEYLVIDLLREFAYPALLVARAALGTVNHTLLSIEIMRQRGIDILGVVINGCRGEEAEADNPRMIEEYGGVKVLAQLPWLAGETDALAGRLAPKMTEAARIARGEQ